MHDLIARQEGRFTKYDEVPCDCSECDHEYEDQCEDNDCDCCHA